MNTLRARIRISPDGTLSGKVEAGPLAGDHDAVIILDGEPSGQPSESEIMRELSDECAALPDLDTRTPEAIVRYDEHGVWH